MSSRNWSLGLKRRHLSKREVKQLLQQLETNLRMSNLDKEGYEEVEDESVKLILHRGEPFVFFLPENLIVPHLKYLLKHGHCFLPKLVVDRGAVKPIASGADVMAPGIVRVEGEFREGELAVVVEERSIPIAVARALFPIDAVLVMKKGKVAENLHHLGDRAWKLAELLG